MNTKFKLISFPEAKKRIERKQFWEELFSKLKNIFKRKTGFEKYKVASWGFYSDHRLWVCTQNIHTGKLKTHRLDMWGTDDQLAREAVIVFVGKLK